MSTTAIKKSEQRTMQPLHKEVGTFIGELFAFNNSLKLFHWDVTGAGSYAKHMALDEAMENLSATTDRIAETSIALIGSLPISIPETKLPNDIIKHATDFYHYVEKHRDLFPEAFSLSILDDYQEAVQQLIYKLVRLQ